MITYRKGDPIPEPESGLLSNSQKWIVRGDTRADRARAFAGKRAQENCPALWLVVSGFMVMGSVPGCLWPVILTQGPSWWCAQPRWIPARILGGR